MEPTLHSAHLGVSIFTLHGAWPHGVRLGANTIALHGARSRACLFALCGAHWGVNTLPFHNAHRGGKLHVPSHYLFGW